MKIKEKKNSTISTFCWLMLKYRLNGLNPNNSEKCQPIPCKNYCPPKKKKFQHFAKFRWKYRFDDWYKNKKVNRSTIFLIYWLLVQNSNEMVKFYKKKFQFRCSWGKKSATLLILVQSRILPLKHHQILKCANLNFGRVDRERGRFFGVTKKIMQSLKKINVFNYAQFILILDEDLKV